METNWAADDLRTIRTLMERSALYRRALAPVMMFNGVLGVAGAIAGGVKNINTTRGFVFYWAAIAALALVGSFLLVRRQALKASEPFWSPPTRRVTQAFLPPLIAGFIITAVICFRFGRAGDFSMPLDDLMWLPLLWVVLYGCAFNAAGFFMQRGMRLFGWIFVLAGCALLASNPAGWNAAIYTHGIMGLFFGALHLAYGAYLFVTEKRVNEA